MHFVSKIRILFLLSLLFFIHEISAQEKIQLERAGSLQGVIINGQNVKKLKKNVAFKQGNTRITCDSAYFYDARNMMEAFGRVKINQEGTNIYSNHLIYWGDTKILNFDGDVILKDKSMTLKTPSLEYNTKTKVGIYLQGGEIEDKGALLTSREGYYNMNSKIFVFKKNVRLKDKDYDLVTDTLNYHTDIKTAYLRGPSVITTKDGVLNATEGEYHTDKNVMKLSGKSEIETDEMILVGDMVNFNHKKQEGIAKGNVKITLKKEKTTIEGDECEYKSKTKETKVKGNVLMTSFMEDDTLYLKANNLISINDSLKKNKKLTAFPNVTFFRKDVQGRCDSLIYNFIDSTIRFYRAPILWASKSQMTGDTITIQMVKNKIDKLLLRTNSFIISEDSIQNFNQIKGKKITAFFDDNKIKLVDVYGNGESVYFATENDTLLMGLNKVICSNMLMKFDDGKLKNISFLTKPEASFVPPKDFTDPLKKLKGFTWRIGEIPLRGNMLNRFL